MCLSVCGIAKHPLPGVVETSGLRIYSLYWTVITQFSKNNALIYLFDFLFHLPFLPDGFIEKLLFLIDSSFKMA